MVLDMAKIASTPVYGKSLLKKISRTRRLITLCLCMQHLAFETYLICSNDDPMLTLNYFMARKANLLPNPFNWE